MTLTLHRSTKRASSMIDDESFGMFAAMFGARLGYEIPDSIIAFTRAELERDGMTTIEFERAGAALLRGKLYAAFPGVDEFWGALAAGVSHDPVPNIAATHRLISAERSRAVPRQETLAAFGADWRSQLADCKPALTGMPKALDAATRPLDAAAWVTADDDLRAFLADAGARAALTRLTRRIVGPPPTRPAPIDRTVTPARVAEILAAGRPSAPPDRNRPRDAPTSLADVIPAALAHFAPLDDSDADAR